MRFTFNLVSENGSDSFENVKLNRFAMQEVVKNVCYVTIRPPEKASYLLTIYAKDMNDKVSAQTVAVALGEFCPLYEHC